jgi:hypothetical protein
MMLVSYPHLQEKKFIEYFKLFTPLTFLCFWKLSEVWKISSNCFLFCILYGILYEIEKNIVSQVAYVEAISF